MSLFPAYGDGEQKLNPNVVNAAVQQSETADSVNVDIIKWQTNCSYELPAKAADNLDSTSGSDSDKSDSDAGSHSGADSSRCSSPTPKPNNAITQRPLEFNASVEFYVDKSCNKRHDKWDTLPPLSRPKYMIRMRRLTDPSRQRPIQRKVKKRKRLSKSLQPGAEPKLTTAELAAKMQRIQELNTMVANHPQYLSNWIELHQLLGQNVSKSNRLAVAEQQLHRLETALEHHPGNEQLLQLYVDTASSTYPDSQVATKIEQLLERTPYEYTLWTALIMTTQGTMARCNVPDVLHIYEQCMRRMHLGPKDKRQHTDELMLKLFHNCVLFLRQSANYGHMFSLLKLALELNFHHLNFECFEACAAKETPLVEYEELVLRSGMPMPEIWTRIERLRQAYNFLPYPQLRRGQMVLDGAVGLDPQRCIYTDDVCHYIYPLKSMDNTMQLLLQTLQLTKLPFVRTNCLAERLCARIDQIGDSEAIEMLLAGLADRYSYGVGCADYTSGMLQMAKELCVSPSFMPHVIGHELYVDCLGQLLLKCSAAFTTPEDRSKRLVFLLLWFRFERLLLSLHKLAGNLTLEHGRQARKRMRQLLAQPDNRDITCLFTEMAMCEYEMASNPEELQRCTLIFERILATSGTDCMDVERLQAIVVRAEMLLALQQPEQALHLLSCLALQRRTDCDDASIALECSTVLTYSRQLLDAALAAASEQGAQAKQAMPLEDYFMPNRLLLLLRAHCLLLFVLDKAQAAQELLQQLLDQPLFALEPTQLERTRCRHLREQLRELQLLLLQLPRTTRATRGPQLVSMLEQSLDEFPRNLAFLQRWSTLVTLPWYKLRARLVRTKAGILALLHLVIATHYRFVQQAGKSGDIDEDLQRQQRAHLVHNRLLSMFETFLPNNPHRSSIEAEQYAILRRNSLYWRLYLRCLSTERTSFERSKRCLLMAIDECPWDKALYMDGVTYVPQELGNLQDVMTEKQLRIYALPEELSVLREA
ncbi:nuclear exosome regulator NRDE2 [Drosophila montana]|uniref:nuclear exosome regulator NRDE2 n=1 Tax=Drosophila montana TaxID=40370 RepID=UPI00313B7FD6